jgi:hypothetical protein
MQVDLRGSKSDPKLGEKKYEHEITLEKGLNLSAALSRLVARWRK